MSNSSQAVTIPSDTQSGAGDWDREVARFIDAGGNTTHSFGLGRLLGRLFALLYLSPEPLSLEQISIRLKISKASASIAVRQLASWHAVHKVQPNEGRRDFYEAEIGFGNILRNGLLPGIRKKFQSAGVQIERTLGAAPNLDKAISSDKLVDSTRRQEIYRRIQAAMELHKKIDALFFNPFLDHML